MALHRIVTMASHTAEPHAINHELLVLAIEDEASGFGQSDEGDERVASAACVNLCKHSQSIERIFTCFMQRKWIEEHHREQGLDGTWAVRKRYGS